MKWLKFLLIVLVIVSITFTLISHTGGWYVQKCLEENNCKSCYTSGAIIPSTFYCTYSGKKICDSYSQNNILKAKAEIIYCLCRKENTTIEIESKVKEFASPFLERILIKDKEKSVKENNITWICETFGERGIFRPRR